MPAPPRFDGCDVVETLHAGAISELYRGVQRPLGRPVLIKAIGASILPSSPFAASLEREARLLAELDHPNIVEVYDFVRKDDRMWMVLEHVDGWTLAEVLTRVGRLPQEAATAVALEVARALAHAHEKGISHRDVQPRNIVLSRRGDVKLVNFSVASTERLETAPELLDGGASYAGPSYMSPEQILGEPPDPRSDLFSLGVVLYEMLAGERPFKAPDERNEALRIRSEPPPPLGRRVSGLLAALERVVLRCLEKMPSDRFDNAAELCEALEGPARELAALHTQRALLSALTRAGLVAAETKSKVPERILSVAPRVRPLGFARAAWPLFALCALLALGIAGVQLAARRDRESGGQAGRTKLELVPQNVAYLRVVAKPWAHVIINGQQVDTTPFARSIPLPAGLHYVRLEHPQATTERRTVKLAPGETVLLDVTMKLTGPVPSAEPPKPKLEPDAGTDDQSP
jgi:hypothetical protein